jgi:putative hydrolase of the HAD superfamily
VARAFGAVGDDLSAPASALATALLEREIDACRPPADAHAHLGRLAEEHTLGVLTNGVHSWQTAKLRTHDLDRYFEAVVASYDVGAHKPAPEVFAAAERRLPGEEYVMVGDAESDVAGARRAGWTARRYRGGGFGDLLDALD